MKDRPRLAAGSETSVTDCWNSIGVRGDASCPELERYVHCRNCHVFSEAALELLDSRLPAGYMADWTRHFGQPKPAGDHATLSVFIFRIGIEWLALATQVVTEVASLRPIHTLPHRRTNLVGIANIRGELVVCVSLVQVLGLEQPAASHHGTRSTDHQRLLVIDRDDVRVVCLVDEVHGIHHVQPRTLAEVPTTVAMAGATYSKHVLPWKGHSVGLLDDGLLFDTLKRSLA